MIELLAAIVGLVAGFQLYAVLLLIMVRFLKKAPLFSRREGILSGGAMLLVGIGIAVTPVIFAMPEFFQAANVFLGAVVTGAALYQLWLCLHAPAAR